MINVLKKMTLGFLSISLLGSHIFANPNDFLNAQNRSVTKDYNRCLEFLTGSKLLTADHIDKIMSSKSWEIVAGRLTSHTACSHTNMMFFKQFLADQLFPEAIISLLTQPLLNDNLITICTCMHTLSYSQSTINAFKKFLLALFSTKKYPYIIDFQESIMNNDVAKVSSYLNEGFRPDWIIDENLSTGLMVAINQNQNNIVDLLLTCPSINLEAMNVFGMHSLMLAIQNSNFKLAQKLLKYQGWDLSLTNKEGQTVFDLAQEYLPNFYRALYTYQPYDN